MSPPELVFNLGFVALMAMPLLAPHAAEKKTAMVECNAAAEKTVYECMIKFKGKNGKAKVDLKTLRVTEGDTVIIHWTSDTPLELHLHGYDIKTVVTPNSPITMRVNANFTGRFAVENHGHKDHADGHGQSHKTLIYLEVHPR